MAYAAVHSLVHEIHRLLDCSGISLASFTRETLASALDHASSLQTTLQHCSEEVGDMDEQLMIIEAARKLEDAIEFPLLSQPPAFSFNLDHDVDCFVRTAKERKEIIDRLWEQKAAKAIQEDVEELFVQSIPDQQEEEEDDDIDVEMVGLCDQFLQIRDYLFAEKQGYSVTERMIWISGMAGIGKTAFARKLFDDPLVKTNFQSRAFVRVGLKFGCEERVFQAIMDQLNLEQGMSQKSLIVLDDVWDYDNLMPTVFQMLEELTGAVVIVTSRINSDYPYIYDMKMRFMNEEESWELLRKKVFGEEEECPPQLVKAGKKIAEKCEGLPLLINAVAPILISTAHKDPECWNRVAEKPDSVLEEASHRISEVLLKSYNQISEDEKLQFLYIASFPLSCIVSAPSIISLWCVEGFKNRMACREFMNKNLVINNRECWSETKAFSLHCTYWYVSRRVAENNKFLYIIKSCADDDLDENVKGHRRLAIQRNVLLAIKEVHNKIASISTVRCVLCTGPYHQYQVPICWEWKLLRVLHALTIRFYEFPVEVVELIRLRYLALTCNANLPPSISKLWNLEFLIVHQHSNIKRVGVESYLPVEIWGMQELIHLEIMGRNLPSPRPGSVLPNLTSLFGVGVESCTQGVVKSIPRLRKLRIQLELGFDAPQTLSCFDHISSLEELKSFQSVVTNASLSRPPPPLLISTSSLKKLSLSGFGYSWEDMSKIAELTCLRVLKLQCYAFRGEMWDAKEMIFLNLTYLLIEDTDLVQWTVGHNSFPRLFWVTMKNCYKLREIPRISTYFDMVDCNPLAETWAKTHNYDPQEEEEEEEAEEYGVTVQYSWKGKEKVKS